MQGAIAGIQLHATLLFYFLGPDALIADQQQWPSQGLEKPQFSRNNRPLIIGQDLGEGGKQLGYSKYQQLTAKKRTKLENFLADMDLVVS